MNKKKITTSLMAVALVSSLAVGSLAWFTSQDTITNPFSTASTDSTDNRVDAGIKIHEKFDPKKAENITPGQKVQKEVKIHSTANYDQFVKANITKEFTYNGKVVDRYIKTPITYKNKQGQDIKTEKITFYNSKDKNEPNGIKLDTGLINLDLTNNSNWIVGKDGFYYYNEVLPAGQDTKALLDSVTLDGQAGNEYKGLGFNVVVHAYSIQAANKAAKDAWNQAPADFNKTVDAYKAATTGSAQAK